MQVTCEKAVNVKDWKLLSVREKLQTEEMCTKAWRKTHGLWSMYLITSRPKNVVNDLHMPKLELDQYKI